MNNLKKIGDIPIVDKAQKMELTEDILSLINKPFKQTAKENSKKIDVYRVMYTSQGHSVAGYIIAPKNNSQSSGEYPCLIYNRGGLNDFGAIKQGELFVDLARFANDGYLVLASQYSGNDGGDGEDRFGGDDIADVINLKHIIDNYEMADDKRIGMYGHSRGGLMAYRALSKVEWIDAAVTVAAPSNEVRAPEFRDGWAEHQQKMYGGGIEEKKRRSAVFWPEEFSQHTPILIMHGTADWRVNPQDSLDLSKKLLEEKVPHRLVMFEGSDHALNEHKQEKEKLSFEWLERFVRKQASLPNLEPHGR